jgi:hypothetical protein
VQQGPWKEPEERSARNERTEQVHRPPCQAPWWEWKTACAEEIGDRSVEWTLRLRKDPWLTGKLGQIDFPAARPSTLQSRHDNDAVMKQDFGADVFFF